MNGVPRPKTTWWGRNWFWAVPLGCLGMCSLPVIFVTGLFGLIFGTMATSEPYVEALEMARVHPEVIEALGEPIEAGWLVMGTFDMSPQAGSMDMSVPLEGPRGTGSS